MVITVVRHRVIGAKAVMWIQALNGGVSNLIHVYQVDGYEDRTGLLESGNWGSDPDVAQNAFDEACAKAQLEQEEAEWEAHTEAANQ